MLPAAQFTALAEDAQAVQAAAVLMEHYRKPPSHTDARPTRWQGQTPLFPADDGKPSARTAFLETDARGLQWAGRAVLWVSSERQPFTLASRRAVAEATQGADLVFVLHLGGRVDSEVTNLNVARAVQRGDGSEEENRLEVHSAKEIPLYEPLFPTKRVSHTRAREVLALYGEVEGSPVLDDIGALPPRHALHPEVLFTGAREGDIVEVVQPRGSSFYLVAPQESAEPPRRRILQTLRRAKAEWRAQADLCLAIQGTASEYCLALLRAEAQLSDPLSDQPEEARAAPACEIAALEEWSTGESARHARIGGAAARQEHFAVLASVAPPLHGKVAALLEGVPPTAVWSCSVVLNGIALAQWTSKTKNVLAVGRLLHNNPGSAPPDSAVRAGGCLDAVAEVGGECRRPKRIIGDSDEDSAGSGADDELSADEEGHEDSSDDGVLAPRFLHGPLVPLEAQRDVEDADAPWRVFRERLRARLQMQGFEPAPDEVQAYRARQPAWESCAQQAQDRVDFWRRLSWEQGLPVEVSLAALALAPNGASLVEEVHGLGSLLDEAGEDEVSRREQ